MSLLLLGVVVSIYLPMSAASVTADGYIGNTHHLVYATLSNLAGAGFLENKDASLREFLLKIRDLHSESSRIAGVNVLVLVAIAGSFA